MAPSSGLSELGLMNQFSESWRTESMLIRKEGQAKIDGGRIERIGGLVEFDVKVIIDTIRLICVDERVGEFCVDVPLVHSVGICHGIPGNDASYAPHDSVGCVVYGE